MSYFKDLTGEKIGKLYIIKRVDNLLKENKKPITRWLCQCECGTFKIVRGDALGRRTNSCGCLKKKLNKQKRVDDPVKSKRLYRIWCCMKNRCYNKNSKAYKNYGGRGIKVCDEWLNNFRTFEKWSLENDYKEELTIDRIDNNGIYEPSNCRWITRQSQNKNKRNNIYITYNGEKMLLKDYATKNNLNYKVLHYKYLKSKKENKNYELPKSL